MTKRRFLMLAGLMAAFLAGAVVASAGSQVAPVPNQIGFYREFSPGKDSLWVVNIDGSDERRLITKLNGAFGHRSSPNYRQIAYSKFSGIYLMRPDGTRRRRIIPDVPVIRTPGSSTPAGRRMGAASCSPSTART